MKAVLIHPYRHHSYNTVRAISNLNCDLEVFYGYYNKQGFIYNFIKRYENNKIISKFLGYNDEQIDKFVNTNLKSNILFLMSKINSKYTDYFVKNFEKSTLKKVKNRDIYFFLQDYCNEIIDYAYKNDKLIVYDHIMPVGRKQRELLLKEVEKYKFPYEYVDKFISQEKIDINYKNIKNSNIIINASNSTYKITEEVLGINGAKEKSFIIPYGVNFDYMEEKKFNLYIKNKYMTIKSRKLKILYVGSISLAKGIGYLIDVISNFRNSNIEFGIVGVPNQEEDVELVKKLTEFKNVTYYGSVPHRQIKNIYKEYDLFIFTSIIEGFGMVTLEAMSMGLPCIVNEYCSSVITNNYDGFIIEKVESESYINVIDDIVNNIEQLESISFNAYKTSKEYSWDRYINALEEILKLKME